METVLNREQSEETPDKSHLVSSLMPTVLQALPRGQKETESTIKP